MLNLFQKQGWRDLPFSLLRSWSSFVKASRKVKEKLFIASFDPYLDHRSSDLYRLYSRRNVCFIMLKEKYFLERKVF